MVHLKTNDSIKIMTLNVNGFRGGTEVKVPDKICLENMEKIKQLIDGIIINKDDIIILQEVPHRIKEVGRKNWFNNPLYNKFNEIFSGYKILKPKHLLDYSMQCTIALCKKESSWEQLKVDILQYDNQHSYGNKFVDVELACGKLTLLGVHMPPDEDMWDLLIKSLSTKPYTYILGDFNAYERRGEMYKKPDDIRKCGYNHLIANNILTCYSYNSSIDNIFIKSDFTIKKNMEIKVFNTKLTDHALCVLKHGY